LDGKSPEKRRFFKVEMLAKHFAKKKDVPRRGKVCLQGKGIIQGSLVEAVFRH
jgi:hypothetical protein